MGRCLLACVFPCTHLPYNVKSTLLCFAKPCSALLHCRGVGGGNNHMMILHHSPSIIFIYLDFYGASPMNLLKAAYKIKVLGSCSPWCEVGSHGLCSFGDSCLMSRTTLMMIKGQLCVNCTQGYAHAARGKLARSSFPTLKGNGFLTHPKYLCLEKRQWALNPDRPQYLLNQNIIMEKESRPNSYSLKPSLGYRK